MIGGGSVDLNDGKLFSIKYHIRSFSKKNFRNIHISCVDRICAIPIFRKQLSIVLVGKLVSDSTNNQIRVPNLRNLFIIMKYTDNISHYIYAIM